MTKVLFALLTLAVVCLTFTTPACNFNPPSPLSGEIALDPAWKPMIYLVTPQHFNEIATDYLGTIVDSAAISQKGHFSFEHLAIPNEKLLTTLVVQKHQSKHANHLADEIPSEANYMPLILSHEYAVVLSAQIAQFQKTCVIDHPSHENDAVLALRDIRLRAYEQLRLSSEDDAENDSLLLEREDAFNLYTKAMRDFADTTRSFEAALVAIRWVSPSGDYERTPELLYGQCQKWSKVQPDHFFHTNSARQEIKTYFPS